MTEMSARETVFHEALARMHTLAHGDAVTNVCAGEGNPHRHAYFDRLVVKQYKNKWGITFTDYYARCNLRKGKSWNTDIKVIYAGHLDKETCEKLFHPIWEAEYGKKAPVVPASEVKE